MTIIQKGYGVYAGGTNYFARLRQDTAIELTGETQGSDLYGYIDNTGNAVSHYLPAGRIKVRAPRQALIINQV